MHLPMQLIVFMLIEFAIFYMIFLNISQFYLRRSEVLVIVFTTVLLSLLGYNLAFTPGTLSLAVNIIFPLVITDVAYTKSKNLFLSLFYTIITCSVFLLVGQFQATILGVIIDPLAWPFPGTRSVTLGTWKLFMLNEPVWAALAFIVSYNLGLLINAKLTPLPEVLLKKFCIYIIIGTAMSFPLFITYMFLLQVIGSQALADIINILLISAYFTYLVFAIYTFASSFHKEDEIRNNKEMLKNLEIYTRSIEEAHTELRQFRHDHRNILMSLYEHIENDDLDGVRDFFKEYVTTFENSSLVMESALSKLSAIQIPEIKSILSQKIVHAGHLGITVHIEVSDIIDKVRFDRVSFCRAVGILIDNAIESCLENEAAVLKFAAFKKDGETSFLFINTCTNPPPIAEMFSRNFSTKRKGGLGLYTLRLMLDKNDNVDLITKVENGNFIQHLIIS